MLVIHQECSQSTQDTSGPHQDGGYYSWKGYGWFLIGLMIFRFFLKFDMSRHAKFQFLEYHRTGDLSIKNALNQPYQCHSLLIIM